MTRFVKKGGGDQNVKVKTQQGCAWTAVSNVSWVEIKGQPQGTGTHDVKYDVERNRSESARIGTITVAGLTHFIVQEPGD